jgi:hypothetical protein
MATYQPDSPSRICDGSLDEASCMVDSSGCLFDDCGIVEETRTYIHASQAAILTPVHTSTPPRASCGALSCGHTRLHRPCSRPPSPHACPCTTSHPHIPHIPLMYSASAVSFLKRQAWGIRQAWCSFPAPHTECISLTR